MSGTPTTDPNLDALRGRAITLKTHGKKIFELIDEVASPALLKDTYNQLAELLQTVKAAASEAINLLESHGTRAPRVTSVSLTDQLSPTDQLKADQSVSQVKSPDGPGGDSFDSAIDSGPQ